MAARRNKTISQQCRYYEVKNIFEYMAETYINGNHAQFAKMFKELDDAGRTDFVDWMYFEVDPQYHIDMVKRMISNK